MRKRQLDWNLQLFFELFKWHLDYWQHFRTRTVSFPLGVSKLFQQNGCAHLWLSKITLMQGQSLFSNIFFTLISNILHSQVSPKIWE